MGNGKRYRAQYAPVVFTRGRGTLISSSDQPPPPTKPQCDFQPNQAGATSPSSTSDSTANAHAIPTPSTSVQGKAGCRQKISCPELGCDDKLTKGALRRHKKHSCTHSRVPKHQYLCPSCDQPCSRPDAVTRHRKSRKCFVKSLQRASGRSTSSSSSGRGGDQTNPPVLSVTSHTPTSPGSLPYSMAVPLLPSTLSNSLTGYGHIQPQPQPTFANPSPYISATDPNYYINPNHYKPNHYVDPNPYTGHNPVPSAVGKYCQSRLTPQYFDQCLPLSSIPNHTSLAAHQERDLYLQLMGSASQISPESALPLQHGDQFLSDTSTTHAPLISNDHTWIRELGLESMLED